MLINTENKIEVIRINNVDVDVRSDKCLYITMGDYVYYIDDSTNEQIIMKWKKESNIYD